MSREFIRAIMVIALLGFAFSNAGAQNDGCDEVELRIEDVIEENAENNEINIKAIVTVWCNGTPVDHSDLDAPGIVESASISDFTPRIDTDTLRLEPLTEDVPQSIVLLLDTSNSMARLKGSSGQLPYQDLQQASDALIEQFPDVEFAILQFNSQTSLTQEFTSDATNLKTAIATAIPPLVQNPDSITDTCLYDALHYALGLGENFGWTGEHYTQRSILLFSDGSNEDHPDNSTECKHSTTEELNDILNQVDDIPIHTMGFGTVIGIDELQRISERTSGIMTSDAENIQNMFNEMGGYYDALRVIDLGNYCFQDPNIITVTMVIEYGGTVSEAAAHRIDLSNSVACEPPPEEETSVGSISIQLGDDDEEIVISFNVFAHERAEQVKVTANSDSIATIEGFCNPDMPSEEMECRFNIAGVPPETTLDIKVEAIGANGSLADAEAEYMIPPLPATPTPPPPMVRFENVIVESDAVSGRVEPSGEWDEIRVELRSDQSGGTVDRVVFAPGDDLGLRFSGLAAGDYRLEATITYQTVNRSEHAEAVTIPSSSSWNDFLASVRDNPVIVFALLSIGFGLLGVYAWTLRTSHSNTTWQPPVVVSPARASQHLPEPPYEDVVEKTTLLNDINSQPAALAIMVPALNDEQSTGRQIDFNRTLTIGRHQGNDLVFAGDQTISARHARIEIHDGIYVIIDRGSSNGTLMNGVKLEADAPTPLWHDSRIKLGQSLELVFIAPQTDDMTELVNVNSEIIK